MIFSTHHMSSDEELCDHITLINRSRNILSGAVAEIRVALRVAAILPADGALWVTARVVAEAGILADPYAPEAAFALRGGASLDEAFWAESVPDAVGTPTRRSDSEVDIPLRFADPPLPNAFFRLLAR